MGLQGKSGRANGCLTPGRFRSWNSILQGLRYCIELKDVGSSDVIENLLKHFRRISACDQVINTMVS